MKRHAGYVYILEQLILNKSFQSARFECEMSSVQSLLEAASYQRR